MTHRRAENRLKNGSPLVPRVKVWLEIDGRHAFCLGFCEMLQAIDRTGSIKQAASDLGRSYRYLWGRIKKTEQVLGQQLVETQVGGKELQRSFLTPSGRQLVHDLLALRRRMIRVVQQECRGRFACLPANKLSV
jgi:molybdate transport system regulatory protein